MNMKVRLGRIARVTDLTQVLTDGHGGARPNLDTSLPKMGQFNLHPIA
nr:hypothetical protein [Phyllobacterium sp. KW56]